MKHFFVAIIIFFVFLNISFAQTTNNTFPSNGYVGIGLTTPVAPLEVVGTTGTFGGQGRLTAAFEQDAQQRRGVYLGFDGSGQIGIIASGTPGGATNPSSLAFYNYNGAGWQESMRLASNGYLGIGTTAPTAPFDVSGVTPNNGYATNVMGIAAFTQNHTTYNGIYLGYDKTSQTGVINSGSTGALSNIAFWNYSGTSWFEAMRISGSGKVGIGTNSPSFPLTLNTGVAGDAMQIKNTGTGNATIELFTNDGSQTYVGQAYGTWGGITGSPSVFQSNKTISITPVLNSPSKGINLLTNGNVGIGTISPTLPFSVTTAVTTGDAMVINNTSTGNAAIDLFASDGSKTYIGQTYGTWAGISGSPSVFESNKMISITPVINTPSKGINLLTNGYVGIGNTSPAVPLDVSGGAAYNLVGTIMGVAGFTQNQTSHKGLGLGYDNANGTQTGILYSGSAGSSSDIAFWNYSGSNWFEAMRITGTGNFGIGTSSPTVKLHVVSGTAGNMAFPYESGVIEKSNDNKFGLFCSSNTPFSGGTAMAGAGYAMAFTNYLNNNQNHPGFDMQEVVYGPNVSQNVLRFVAYERNNGGVILNPVFAMAISGNGNVGIGISDASVSNSNYKLSVNGFAHAKRVDIDVTNWNDYVFDPTYKLPILADVKAYIDQNHHLPEIPSEQEMIKNGMNIGEMNKILVKKVEELTLYTIDQDNKLKEQELRLKKLEEMVEKLSKEK